MESFIPKSLLQDVNRMSMRRTSFAVPKPVISGFSKGRQSFKVDESTADMRPITPRTKKDDKQIAFLYDSPPIEKTDKMTDRDPIDPVKIITEGPSQFDTDNIKMVALKKVFMSTINDKDTESSIPKTTRRDVTILKAAAIKLLQEIGADTNTPYPSEMHAFLAIIEEEQKVYDSVFDEIIRQVSINMTERGDLLAEIRKRYSAMFLKIPRHVRHLHTELVAQRKLNKRMAEELVRAKEAVRVLLDELNHVKKHDADITKKAQEAHEKLVAVLTQSDNTDEILEEYHKLYRMQRDRLEEALRISEQEKRIWIDAALVLALRIGSERNVQEIVDIQKHENNRLATLNGIIILINDANNADIQNMEKKIEFWRSKLINLSQSVVEEDHINMEILARIQREMRMLNKNLLVNEPVDAVEANHPLLSTFHIHDVKSVIAFLSRWGDEIAKISARYTSDKDISMQETISHIRKLTENWIDVAFSTLKRNQKNVNGKDYIVMADMLSKISVEIEEWLMKIEKRISGDDGVASQIIGLQNQVEDRFAAYSVREKDKPLPANERTQLRDCLGIWTEQVTLVSNLLSNTTEKEQQKIPLHVENWLSSLIDQINTDTDVRNEENQKIHNSVISWMVNLLVISGKPDAEQNENIDHEFQLLNHEVSSFNKILLKDSAEIDSIDIDMKANIQLFFEEWQKAARRLLLLEKAHAEAVKSNRREKTTLTLSQENLLKKI